MTYPGSGPCEAAAEPEGQEEARRTRAGPLRPCTAKLLTGALRERVDVRGATARAYAAARWCLQRPRRPCRDRPASPGAPRPAERRAASASSTRPPRRRSGAGWWHRDDLRGGTPRPSSGRCVMPTVGRSSSAPRCSARPAPLGWSRAVASTSSTSGRVARARTASSMSRPSRSASRPGEYGAPAAPRRTSCATTWSPRITTAATHAASPALPRPRSPRGKHTQQPPTSRSPTGGRHGSGSRLGELALRVHQRFGVERPHTTIVRHQS